MCTPVSHTPIRCALKLHPLFEPLFFHNLLHLRSGLAVQVDALQLFPGRISDDKLRVVVLDPLYLGVPVLLPLLLLLQPLLQVPVVGLIQSSARAGLKPTIGRRVRHERRLGDSLVVAAPRHLASVHHDRCHHAVIVQRRPSGTAHQQHRSQAAAHPHGHLGSKQRVLAAIGSELLQWILETSPIWSIPR